MGVAVGEILRNGVLFDMKNWGNRANEAEELPDAVEQLFTVLLERQVDYLLVGGVALLSYVEGRNTQDIDFILAKNDLVSIPELVIREENADFARGMFGAVQVDLLLTQNRLFHDIKLHYATERQFGTRTIRCVTVEGLLLLKFYDLPSLYRQGQFNKVNLYESDITALLLEYSVDLPKLLETLSPHLIASDFQKVLNIASDVQARIQRLQAYKESLDNES